MAAGQLPDTKENKKPVSLSCQVVPINAIFFLVGMIKRQKSGFMAKMKELDIHFKAVCIPNNIP